MPKIDSEAIMKKSVYELATEHKWSRQARDTMVCLVHECDKSVGRGESKTEKRKELDSLEKQTTLRQVLDVLEEIYAKYHPANRMPGHGSFREEWRSLLSKFVELGLTILDSIVLPQNTVTVEMLKEIPRDKLLAMDARILGTLTPTNLRDYCFDYTKDGNYWEHPLPFPTIERLLSSSSGTEEMFKATRRLLSELGFVYEDGLFMQTGTKRRFVEDLVREEGIDKNAAEIVARIAEKKGWVKFPMDNL